MFVVSNHKDTQLCIVAVNTKQGGGLGIFLDTPPSQRGLLGSLSLLTSPFLGLWSAPHLADITAYPIVLKQLTL